MAQRTLLEADNQQLFNEELRQAFGGTLVGRVGTNDATQTTLLTIPLQAGHTTLVRVRVVARRTGGSAGTAEDGAAYELMHAFNVLSGVATSLSGSMVTVFAKENQAGWDADIVASGQSALVRVTGATNNTIVWVAVAHILTVST